MAIYKATEWWLGTDGRLHTFASASTIVPPVPPIITPPLARAVITSTKNLTANFSAATTTKGTNAIASYLWDFGDGASASGLTVSRTYAKTGTYYAKVTVVDTAGLIGVSTLVTVLVTAPPAAPPVPTITIAPNTDLSIEATVDSGANYSHAWSFGDGGAATGDDVTHTYTANGTYAVKVIRTDSTTGLTSTATVNTTISYIAPPSNVQFTTTVSGLSARVDAKGTVGATGFDWNWGDGSAHGAGSFTDHTYATAGTYTITLTASNAGNKSITYTSQVTVTAVPTGLAYDFSESNNPALAATTESAVTASWPAGWTATNLSTASADFATNLRTTIGSKRTIVRLPAGTFHLTSFQSMPGGALYNTGFWSANLQGLIGVPGKTIIQLDANIMTSDMITALQGMTQASFTPNHINFMRIDSTPSSPVMIGGITFQAADQQNITKTGDAFNPAITLPQSAPHQGINLYTDTVGSSAYISYVQFLGAGRALNSQPPFEQANVTSQHMRVYYNNVNFDGRRAASINSSRPRRCGVWMGNNETVSSVVKGWFHHSNLSRYAANDQNGGGNGGVSASYGKGQYTIDQSKFEQVTNTNNDGNGGYTNATPIGFESTAADIKITNSIISRDNPYTGGQYPAHLQLTDVGGIHRDGGTFLAQGNTYRDSVYPLMNGYLVFRVSTAATYWTDLSQITIKNAAGATMTPVRMSSLSPTNPRSVTQAQIDANGWSPSTHYFVEGA